MATESVETFKVPANLITSSNCIAIPNDWDYSYGTPETTFKVGDLMVVDRDACPKHGDVVVMCRHKGGKPFGRQCFIAPAELDRRERWVMGVLDSDGETVHYFKLGEFAWVGVVTGIVPANERVN